MEMTSKIDPLHRSFTYSRLGDKPQVVLELKAKDEVRRQESTDITKATLRFVLVVDVSASMDSPYGKDGISKLEKMKVFAESLTEYLSYEDELGIVCFSAEADVIHNLSPLANDTKVEAVQKIQKLKSIGNTNLSDGLLLGVELFKNHRNGVLYHDKIILFTDGEANAGITEAEELLPAIQQRMKHVANNCGYGDDYRISISVFSTGGFLPDLIIKIGNKFSNEAFYFLNENTNLEQELYKSVVLHEATAIKSVKIEVRTLNGVHLDENETFKEYLETNCNIDSDSETDEQNDWNMAVYFIDTVPFGIPKHLLFSLVLPFGHEYRLRSKNVLRFDLKYKGINGQVYEHTDFIPYSELPNDDIATTPAMETGWVKNGQQIVRKKASSSLDRAAKKLRKKRRSDTIKEIQSGRGDIQQTCEAVKGSLTVIDNKIKMGKYTTEIVACMNGCLEITENPDEGNSDVWATLKAEASGLARETPVCTDSKASYQQLFPLPKDMQNKLGTHLGKVCELKLQRTAMPLVSDQEAESTIQASQDKDIETRVSNIETQVSNVQSTMAEILLYVKEIHNMKSNTDLALHPPASTHQPTPAVQQSPSTSFSIAAATRSVWHSSAASVTAFGNYISRKLSKK